MNRDRLLSTPTPPEPPIGPVLVDGTSVEHRQVVVLIATGCRVTWKTGEVQVKCFGTGSGFVVSPDGYILTNRHVIEQAAKGHGLSDRSVWLMSRICEEIGVDPSDISGDVMMEFAEFLGGLADRIEPSVWVMLDDSVSAQAALAEIVYVAGPEGPDLAILRVKPQSAGALKLRASLDQLPPGSQLTALGFPGSPRELTASKRKLWERILHATIEAESGFTDIESHFDSGARRYSLRQGVLSKERQVKYGTGVPEGRLIEHDAKISHGDSGGPVLDDSGRVIAINAWAVDGGSFGYALVLCDLRELLDTWIPGITWE